MEEYTYDETQGLGMIGFAIYILIILFYFVVNWKIYEKAGKPGWAAIVPIYNVIVYLEIIGKPVWWFFMFLIPGVNIVFGIWSLNLFCKSFGKDELWTVGMLFISFILMPILAFGNAKYVGPAGSHGAKVTA